MNRSTCPASPSLRPLAMASLLLAALLTAPLAFAQQAGDRIEQQMTAEQFKAAGLDQLNTEQLDHLNAWLNRTLVVETTKAAEKAAEQATKKVEADNRGFLDFGSSDEITTRIQGEFNGFGEDREYQLENGQVWRQTDSATLAGVHLDSPQVTIKPSVFGSTWYLQVEGYNTSAKVKRVK